jgi:Domain of unknown function (DUF4861)
MNRRSISPLVVFFLFASTVCAADASKWFELKDFGPLTQRVAVTVSNPADVPVEAALVHIPMADLQKVLPDAKADQLCVVDPQHKPAKRDAADLEFVPHQVSQETLIFAVPLKAKEKKTIHIYTAPQHLNMPGFPAKTAWDNRHAYRSFENNIIAYRMETGPGANTMGLGIDSFGKTEKGRGLRLVEAYEHGHDSYHKLSYWGVDILKVGYGPAIGGMYVVNSADGQMGRPQFATSVVECVYQGPVETLVKCIAPVEVAGKTVIVTRMLTLVGDDRTIRDTITVAGAPPIPMDGLQLAVAIRDLPNGTWIEQANPGYAISSGDSNQPESGYTSVAISAVLPKSSFEKVIEIKDEKGAKPGFGDAGHAYLLKPEKDANGALVASNRLTMIWNGDGEISKTEDLDKACQRWCAQRDNPIAFEVAKESERH